MTKFMLNSAMIATIILSSESAFCGQDVQNTVPPGQRQYLSGKVATIYEGSLVRNVLGFSRILKLKPITIDSIYDESLHRRYVDQLSTVTPESVAKALNNHSGLFNISYNRKDNRFEMNALNDKKVAVDSLARAKISPLRHSEEKKRRTTDHDHNLRSIDLSKADQLAVEQTSDRSIKLNKANAITVQPSLEAITTTLNKTHLAITNKQISIAKESAAKVTFTVIEGETLREALTRLGNISNNVYDTHALTFEQTNQMLRAHKYSDISYLDITRKLLRNENLIVDIRE